MFICIKSREVRSNLSGEMSIRILMPGMKYDQLVIG